VRRIVGTSALVALLAAFAVLQFTSDPARSGLSAATSDPSLPVPVDVGGVTIGELGGEPTPMQAICRGRANRVVPAKTIVRSAIALADLRHRAQALGTRSARADYGAAVARYDRLVRERNAVVNACLGPSS